MECLEDLEEHLDLTLSRSVSGLRVLLMPVSDPTVIEELVEERVVLEPQNLQWNDMLHMFLLTILISKYVLPSQYKNRLCTLHFIKNSYV